MWCEVQIPISFLNTTSDAPGHCKTIHMLEAHAHCQIAILHAHTHLQYTDPLLLQKQGEHAPGLQNDICTSLGAGIYMPTSSCRLRFWMCRVWISSPSTPAMLRFSLSATTALRASQPFSHALLMLCTHYAAVLTLCSCAGVMQSLCSCTDVMQSAYSCTNTMQLILTHCIES